MIPHVEVARNYLAEQFPYYKIEDMKDFDQHAHKFKVSDDSALHMLIVSYEYIHDTDAGTFESLLRNEDIASHMRNPDFRHVMISNKGDIGNQPAR